MSGKPPIYLRFLGSGIELVVWFFAFMAVGAGIDHYFVWQTPVGKVTCGLLGFAFAMYNLVRRLKKLDNFHFNDNKSE